MVDAILGSRTFQRPHDNPVAVTTAWRGLVFARTTTQASCDYAHLDATLEKWF
jgi:hypothetical protein